MAFDPLSSLVFGIVLFDEALHETALGYTLEHGALATTLAGLLVSRGRRVRSRRPPSVG